MDAISEKNVRHFNRVKSLIIGILGFAKIYFSVTTFYIWQYLYKWRRKTKKVGVLGSTYHKAEDPPFPCQLWYNHHFFAMEQDLKDL